jgi:hypothetical protein
MIDSIDRNTITGIMFLTIHLDTLTINDDLVSGYTSEPDSPQIDENVFTAGEIVSVETNFSFIRFDTEVEIINQNETEIEFIVPYDVDTLTITTKDEQGNNIVMNYQVI